MKKWVKWNMDLTYEIYCIKDQSPTRNNVYLIADKETREAVVVDPACIIEQIRETLLNFDLTLKSILITHTHPDHVRSVDALASQYSCRVYVSRAESEYYFYRCQNIRLFEDGEILNIGKTWIRCILTPGHTVGSSCFLLENSLFSGDTVFMEGCGICSLNGSSASRMFHSIAKLKQLAADSVRVYSGHTYKILPGKSMLYLKHNNIYFMIEDEEQFIKFRTRKHQKNLFDFT